MRYDRGRGSLDRHATYIVATYRWIAATALRLGVPLVSNDRIFEGTPGLLLEAVRS